MPVPPHLTQQLLQAADGHTGGLRKHALNWTGRKLSRTEEWTSDVCSILCRSKGTFVTFEQLALSPGVSLIFSRVSQEVSCEPGNLDDLVHKLALESKYK